MQRVPFRILKSESKYHLYRPKHQELQLQVVEFLFNSQHFHNSCSAKVDSLVHRGEMPPLTKRDKVVPSSRLYS